VNEKVDFTVVVRGYDRREVDAVVSRVDAAQGSSDPALRASVRAELSRVHFPVRLRGYDRMQVDDYVERSSVQLR
jgi:DivIVA domain-containing protein